MSAGPQQRMSGDPRCLHCVLNYAVNSWAQRNAPRNDAGTIVLDVAEVIAKTAEMLGELVYKSTDSETRAKFERYSYECLAAAFQSYRTGEVVSVSVNDGPPS